MAYRLFDALNRAAKTFGGAPDPRGISPQMQSNLDRRASQVRFQGFRRMQGRPGITGPFGFVAGRTAPISPQAAATWVSGKLRTQYAPELNRLTAPDPMTFARGARAPEAIGQELGLGAAGVTAAELANRAVSERMPFIAPGLQQELDVGEQGLDVARTEEAQQALLRPSEVTQAGQAVARGELDIEAMQREATREPLPEEARVTRETTQRTLETQAEQAEIGPLVEALQAQVETANLQGDYDRARQLENRIQSLLEGRTGPPLPSVGGAPPISTANINPVMLQRRSDEATAIGEATGLDGAIAMLNDVADDSGLPSSTSVQKLETALITIKQSLAMAPNEQTRDIMKAKIRNSEGYIGIRQRAGLGDMALRGLPSLHPLIGGLQALTGGRPDKLRASQQLAKEIVDLIEGQ